MEDKETKKLPVYAFDEKDYLVEVKQEVNSLVGSVVHNGMYATEPSGLKKVKKGLKRLRELK